MRNLVDHDLASTQPRRLNEHRVPLESQAAQACFGTPHWPADRPTLQTSIEFDVADAAAVKSAAHELQQAGYELLHPPRRERWGQTVTRLHSPEGAIIGVSIPSFHDRD